MRQRNTLLEGEQNRDVSDKNTLLEGEQGREMSDTEIPSLMESRTGRCEAEKYHP